MSCRRNTDGATQTTAAVTYQPQPWEQRQSWHALLYPDSLDEKQKNTESQVSKEENCALVQEDDLNSDDPAMVVCTENLPDQEPRVEEIPPETLNGDPKAPPTTPRAE